MTIVHGPTHDWLTVANRSASDHPVLPNEGTVERRHHSAEGDANDNPGPQIRLLGFVDLTHRELVLLRSRRLRVFRTVFCYSVSSQRNRAYLATVSGKAPRPGGGCTTEAWPALHMGCHMRQQRGQPNRAH